MSCKLFGRITLLVAVFAATFASGAEKFPAEMAVTRAKASVFKVLAKVDFTVSYPKDLQFALTDGRAFTTAGFDAAYDLDLKSRKIKATKSRSDYYWEKLAGAPEEYVTHSPVVETRKFPNAQVGSGTCFAISRVGIFLTNAHVVADPDPEKLLDDDGMAFSLFGEPLVEFFGRASKTFGSEPSSPEFTRYVLLKLLEWWKPKCKIVESKFQEAEIVLDYRSEPKRPVGYENAADGGIRWPQRMPTFADMFPPALPIVISAKIFAVGSAFPGEDVAVLQTAPLTAADSYPLICLSLGDSDTVHSGMRVHALGFPGIAFARLQMDAKAEFQCSAVDGTIGNRKTMLGGMEAFETSLGINHGDSGGPQIDEAGNVIAISVAGAVHAHSYSIPINTARKYLNRRQNSPGTTITLDPGPLTRLWVDGLTLYANGRYAEAKGKFDEISAQSNPVLLSLGLTGGRTNPCVKEMIALCERKLQQSSGQGAIAPKEPFNLPKKPATRRGATPEALFPPFDFRIPK